MLEMEDLQELLWGFARHRIITVAGSTGILGLLARERTTTAQAAERLGLDPLATGKMVRALTALGLLEADGEAYIMTPSLTPSFAGGPADLADFLEHSHHLYDSWGENLESWVRGGDWAHKPRMKSEVPKFARAMQAMGSQVAQLLVGALDLEGARSMLDVGGSLGHYARALLQAAPRLRATILDAPEVVALAREAAADTGLEGRLDFIGGDYLEADYGSGYDLALCANILHQESPTRAEQLVQRCAAALAPGGRCVALDFSIDEHQRASAEYWPARRTEPGAPSERLPARSEEGAYHAICDRRATTPEVLRGVHGDAEREPVSALGALFAVNMRSFGDTYTESTIRSWMEGAGLGQVERIDLNRQRWLIIGRKPAPSSR